MYTLNFKSAGDSWTESSDTFHAQFNDGTNWSNEYVMFTGVDKNEFKEFAVELDYVNFKKYHFFNFF